MTKHKKPHTKNAQKSGQNRGKTLDKAKTSAPQNRQRGSHARSRPSSKGGSPEQNAYLYGLHAVLAALENPKRRLDQLICTAQIAKDLSKNGGSARIKPEVATGAEIGTLLPPGAVHQGIALKTTPLHEPDLESVAATTTKVAILDQVTDPHNVGAILRSAAVFGVSTLIMTDRNSPPQSGVLAKSASGALEHVSICRVGNLARAMEKLGKQGFTLIGLDGDSNDELSALDLSGQIGLVLGAEGAGLRRLTREYCDWLAKLPASGPMRSLNVSNAAAVAFYELSR
jgi:23S rRNA (guanosine2251-2'-O)-methyltransferase